MKHLLTLLFFVLTIATTAQLRDTKILSQANRGPKPLTGLDAVACCSCDLSYELGGNSSYGSVQVYNYNIKIATNDAYGVPQIDYLELFDDYEATVLTITKLGDSTKGVRFRVTPDSYVDNGGYISLDGEVFHWMGDLSNGDFVCIEVNLAGALVHGARFIPYNAADAEADISGIFPVDPTSGMGFEATQGSEHSAITVNYNSVYLEVEHDGAIGNAISMSTSQVSLFASDMTQSAWFSCVPGVIQYSGIHDGGFAGIQGFGDYSPGYAQYSLPDVGYTKPLMLPGPPVTAPDREGMIYIDSVANEWYISTCDAAVSCWHGPY